MAPERFRYCLDQLKRYDHDRYLSVLLAPAPLRSPLAAVYAFEAELDRIPYTVSEPMLGEIRFQWWRDTLEGMTPASRPGHEIAEALKDVLFDAGVHPTDLLPLIELRSAQLTADPFQRIDDLVAHVAEVAGEGLRLAVAFSRGRPTVNAGWQSTATAYGLVRHLRQVPFAAGAQKLLLPLDLMGAYDVDPHDVFDGVCRPGLKLAIADLVQVARNCYQAAGVKMQDPGLRAALLACSLTPLYLAKMTNPGFDLLRHPSDVPAFRRQLRLLRTILTKKL